MDMPLKWHGGKYYLAAKIISLMPPHVHYVEPFFGGGAVLLARDPNDERLWLPPHKGVSEVVNDINGRLVNFWRVLQDSRRFAKFKRLVEAVPLSKVEWEKAHKHEYGRDAVSDAVAFFVDWGREAHRIKPITQIQTRHDGSRRNRRAVWRVSTSGPSAFR